MDTTNALFRRMIIVPFDARFEPGMEGYDPHIVKKLEAELPGIFNLVVEGYKRLLAQGAFTHSDATQTQLDEYRATLNPVIPWKQENLYIELFNENTEIHTSTVDLYQDFVLYCDQRGFRAPNYNSFSKRLHELMPEADKRRRQKRIEGKATWGFRGVRLLDGKDDF